MANTPHDALLPPPTPARRGHTTTKPPSDRRPSTRHGSPPTRGVHDTEPWCDDTTVMAALGESRVVTSLKLLNEPYRLHATSVSDLTVAVSRRTVTAALHDVKNSILTSPPPVTPPTRPN